LSRLGRGRDWSCAFSIQLFDHHLNLGKLIAASLAACLGTFYFLLKLIHHFVKVFEVLICRVLKSIEFRHESFEILLDLGHCFLVLAGRLGQCTDTLLDDEALLFHLVYLSAHLFNGLTLCLLDSLL